ncbi:hypothetical protein ARMGADRAFT_798121 [Armillaria gallica]|uniref:Uncharacterized protein n=1 Tax=Armillaria gallica TaxID=47427 RepID=A0A2H3E499_ARMGA|nr:hypothetical protein ARMGADRAFT_798121 [Armillaria gallica]
MSAFGTGWQLPAWLCYFRERDEKLCRILSSRRLVWWCRKMVVVVSCSVTASYSEAHVGILPPFPFLSSPLTNYFREKRLPETFYVFKFLRIIEPVLCTFRCVSSLKSRCHLERDTSRCSVFPLPLVSALYMQKHSVSL